MLLLLIFELIHQATLVNFMFFLNIVKILKVSFWTFWRKICISLDLWALFLWKLCKAFRIVQCKQLRFLKSFKFWSIFHIQNLWYSFTRDNSFLQTFTSLSQKNPSTNTSRHINNITALVCIFSLILNCSLANQKNSIMNGWKCRSKGLLKLFFCHQKSNKKADRLCMKVSSTSNTRVQSCLYPLFQNQYPHFMFSLFSENYLNPQVKINKMVKHTVYYRSSPS